MSGRYVVIGAGAVGAALAAGLREAGIPVLLISRGRTYHAISEHGLRFTHDGRERVLDVPTTGSPADVQLTADDVLVLAVKSQDAAAALAEWAGRPIATGATAGESLTLVTLQNGLDAERAALRHFASVLGGTTLTGAVHTVPGEVIVRNAPKFGQIILGAYPTADAAPSVAERVSGIAADFRAANWLVHEAEDIRRWKAWKATTAAAFAVEVFDGIPEDRAELKTRIQDEARTVLAAAGHTFASPSELSFDPAEARIAQPEPGAVVGLSTWQSFARGSGSEVDFLSGEIVLQARLAGIPAPVNTAVQQALAAAAAAGEKPGERPIGTVLDGIRDSAGVHA